MPAIDSRLGRPSASLAVSAASLRQHGREIDAAASPTRPAPPRSGRVRGAPGLRAQRPIDR